MSQENMATKTVLQQGSQRQEQTKCLYWRQSDIAQRAVVKLTDALHIVNNKPSDFNQIFVNLLSDYAILKLSVCLLNVNWTPFWIFDQYWRSKFVLLVEYFF